MTNLKIIDILPSLPKTKKIVDTFHSYKGYSLAYHHVFFKRFSGETIGKPYAYHFIFKKNTKHTRILFVFVPPKNSEVNKIFRKHLRSLNKLLDTYISLKLVGKEAQAFNPFSIFCSIIEKYENYQVNLKIILSEYVEEQPVVIILPYIRGAHDFFDDHIEYFFSYLKSFKFETLKTI